MKKKNKITLFIIFILTSFALLAFLGLLGSINIVRSIFRNINSQQSGPSVNFTAAVFISEIFDENKLYPMEKLNNLKLNKKHVADIINVLVIKNKLNELLSTNGALPKELYSKWPDAPLNTFGKKYYYHLITENWVIVASLEHEENFSNFNFNSKEEKLFQVKGQDLLIAFPIISSGKMY